MEFITGGFSYSVSQSSRRYVGLFYSDDTDPASAEQNHDSSPLQPSDYHNLKEVMNNIYLFGGSYNSFSNYSAGVSGIFVEDDPGTIDQAITIIGSTHELL